MESLRPLAALLLLACTTPVDTTDVEETDAPDSPACESTLVIDYPGGDSSPMPCLTVAVETTMEFDPDDPPELRTLKVVMDGSDGQGFECGLSFQIDGVCDDGSYRIGSLVSLDVETFDCEGTPDLYEGVLPGLSGVIVLDELSTSTEVGNLTGQSIPVGIVGSMDIQLRDGARLHGAFQIAVQVTGADAEEEVCADNIVVDVRALQGGALSGSWGTTGGNIRHYAYDLQIGGGVTPVGCPNCDVVGNLRFRNLTGEPFVDRSDETAAFGLDSHNGIAYEQDPTSLVWVVWGNGQTSGESWEGSRSGSFGAADVDEILELRW
jgi:hypothetical protein